MKVIKKINIGKVKKLDCKESFENNVTRQHPRQSPLQATINSLRPLTTFTKFCKPHTWPNYEHSPHKINTNKSQILCSEKL